MEKGFRKMAKGIPVIALMILRCDGEYVKSGVVRCSELEELLFDRTETPIFFKGISLRTI